MKETIEEAAREFDKSKCKHFRREHTKEAVYDSFEEGFIAGAKYQAERMHSEEDIAIAFNEGQAYSVRGKLVDGKEWAKTHKKEWFGQFKKK